MAETAGVLGGSSAQTGSLGPHINPMGHEVNSPALKHGITRELPNYKGDTSVLQPGGYNCMTPHITLAHLAEMRTPCPSTPILS